MDIVNLPVGATYQTPTEDLKKTITYTVQSKQTNTDGSVIVVATGVIS